MVKCKHHAEGSLDVFVVRLKYIGMLTLFRLANSGDYLQNEEMLHSRT